MTANRLLSAVIIAFAVLLGSCGFHLRKEAQLPPGMQRVHIESQNPSSELSRNLTSALQRAGVQLVAAGGAGTDAALLKIDASSLTTNVLTVSSSARANQYSLRYHVEFEVLDSTGAVLLAKQSIDLSRDFVFDASQTLGVGPQIELLTTELERDMVQTMLRRIDAISRASEPAGG